MSIAGVFDAKNRLTALLDEVEQGGEVVITRRGKPVARLVPVGGDSGREKAQRAADALLELGSRLTLGVISIKELTEAGRD